MKSKLNAWKDSGKASYLKQKKTKPNFPKIGRKIRLLCIIIKFLFHFKETKTGNW